MMRGPLFALFFAALSPAFAQEPPVVSVTVTAKGCEPNALTIKAGRVTFLIKNASSRALEWEILKGVMIIDERENIAPGFKQKLTTTLEPGEYETACGLLSNPRGKLTVLNDDGGVAAGPSKPSAVELLGVAAEHRVWTIGMLKALTDASAAGDRAGAREAFARLSALAGFAPPQAAALQSALDAPQADLLAPAAAYADALRKAQISPLALIQALAAASRALAAASGAELAARAGAVAAQAGLLSAPTRRADPTLAASLETHLAALGAGGPAAAAALAGDLDRLPSVLGLN